MIKKIKLIIEGYIFGLKSEHCSYGEIHDMWIKNVLKGTQSYKDFWNWRTGYLLSNNLK